MLWGQKHTRLWLLLLIKTLVLLQMTYFTWCLEIWCHPLIYLLKFGFCKSLLLPGGPFYVNCVLCGTLLLRSLLHGASTPPLRPGASPAEPALSLGWRTTIQAQRRSSKSLALIISPIIRAEPLPVETTVISSRTPSTCPRNSFTWHACSKWKERKKKKE